VRSAHLREHFAENVTLDELARAAHSSKYHLVRQFRTITGTPPHGYQLALRIVEARRLLERGGCLPMSPRRPGSSTRAHFHGTSDDDSAFTHRPPTQPRSGTDAVVRCTLRWARNSEILTTAAACSSHRFIGLDRLYTWG
jgi:AraC-like DNA-binding protein